MRARAIVGCLLLVLVAGGAPAQDDAADPRRHIAAERKAADARYESEAAACRQGFAVNACLDDARRRHRQAVAALQARQRTFEEARRRQRADERQAEVARKQAEVARRAAAPASAPAPKAGAAAAASAPRPRAAASARDASPDAAAKAAARAQAARKLQAEIKADQARIQARTAKRAAQGKQPSPLPPAPGASAAR